MSLYDRIGRSYTRHRAADPAIRARIDAAIADAGSLVNVGAGAGSYEPRDRMVVAVEPSPVMIAQRDGNPNPVVAAFAEALPFAGAIFDVALAALTVHHWSDARQGLAEMRRVSRRSVVLTFTPAAMLERFWLVRDYLPSAAAEPGLPEPEEIAEAVGAGAVTAVPIPAACRDGFLTAYWKRPEAYLDPSVRSAISLFHRLDAKDVQRMVLRLSEDLASGVWARRNADLARLDELDLGLRLVT